MSSRKNFYLCESCCITETENLCKMIDWKRRVIAKVHLMKDALGLGLTANTCGSTHGAETLLETTQNHLEVLSFMQCGQLLFQQKPGEGLFSVSLMWTCPQQDDLTLIPWCNSAQQPSQFLRISQLRHVIKTRFQEHFLQRKPQLKKAKWFHSTVVSNVLTHLRGNIYGKACQKKRPLGALLYTLQSLIKRDYSNSKYRLKSLCSFCALSLSHLITLL